MEKKLPKIFVAMVFVMGIAMSYPILLQAEPNTAPDNMDKGLKADSAGDYAHAMQWYLKAGDQGASAECNIGAMYGQGHGVPQNYHEAMRWFQMAASQGNASAQCNIGVLFEMGRGVPQDYLEAMKWFQRAAAQRNALAEYKIGSLYSKGHGVPRDYQEALKWYQKAAAQGYLPAQKVIAEIQKILAN